ncbi:AAA family ATPase, partial [Corynebacterium sp.]|uniref:AAA family ATPase n=1 Tax=Corynebacterium sp. TaxID=1720 RepID=UPI002A920E84
RLEAIEREQSETQPQAEEAQQVWFELSTLAERASATVRIATERAGNARVDVAYHGQDPDDLLARANVADEQHADALEKAEEAAERLETVREEVAELQEAFDDAEREHLAQVRAIADRREGVVRLLTQEESRKAAVAAAENEIARLGETLGETRERSTASHAEAGEVADRLASLEAERAPLDEAHVRAHTESDAAEKRLEQLRAAQRNHERAVFSLESRISTLEEQTPTVPAADALGDGFDAVATKISARDGVDTAAAAALGPYAEALVGAGEGVVEKLVGAERAVVFYPSGGEEWRLETDQPVDWLLDHLTIAAELRGPVTRLLVDVALVDSPEAARALVDADPRLRAVTRDGVLVGEGWVAAGSGHPTAVELSGQIERATEELEQARAQLEELSGTFEGARIAAEDARVAAAGAKAALREHDANLAAWRRDYERLVKQYEANRAEHDRASERATEAEARLVRLREDLAETQDRLARVESEDRSDEPSTGARDAANAALKQARAAEMEAALAARSAQQEAEATAGRGPALRRQADHERQAKARHEAAMAKRKAEAELAVVVAQHARDIVARATDALERATAQRDALTARVNSLRAQHQQARSAVSAARQQLERLTQNAHNSDIARSQAQVRIDEAEAKITESLGISVTDLLESYTPRDDFDRASEQQRLAQAEKDLRSLGKVNPLALEEYKALEERYSFLSTQLDDVIQARRDLLGVIEDVDDHILQLFTDAWHDVQAEFPNVFHTLFPGGEARLVLTAPDDLLATGIEIEARPPGKRVKRLSLLSGGEKSLTALAFLVAIFRARPSPFYVLDEVEAALDDVNLRRLIALLEELRQDSQLIVITHQKPTMDVANVLYGVTMRGDGVTRVISQRMSPAGATPASPEETS